MRKTITLAAACAVALLLPAAAGAADLRPLNAAAWGPAPRAALATPEQAAALHATRAALPGTTPRPAWRRQATRSATPLLDALTATVDGTVLKSGGAFEMFTSIGWAVGSAHGEGNTDGVGHFSFGGVPVTSAGNGRLWLQNTIDKTYLQQSGLTWTAAGPNTFDMRPGSIDLTPVAGGPWAKFWENYYVTAYTDEGSVHRYACRLLGRTAGASGIGLPGTVTDTELYFSFDEGDEVDALNGLTVTAGGVSPASATVDEASAKRVWTGVSSWSGPRGSGKPGSVHKLWLKNYPLGWSNVITGFGDNPSHTAHMAYGTKASKGPAAHYRTLTIPRSAVPGYDYNLRVTHANGPLELNTSFQVCTLNASKTSIRKGTAVRFSGVIPVQGHAGSRAGKPSTVYMWVHRGTASQPTKMDARGQGWALVGAFKTDGYGRYHTPLARPTRTLSVVMAYLGDNFYYPGFTSPRKVTVR